MAVSKSRQKRLKRQLKKMREKPQRNQAFEKDRGVRTVQEQRDAIWPAFKVNVLDPAGEEIVQSVTAAWLRAAQSKELQGEKFEDLKVAKVHGFTRCKFGPLNWSVFLGELLYRELLQELEPVIQRRHDVEVFAASDGRSHVELNIRSLERVKPFIVCSPLRPRIRIGTEEYVVAFNFREDDHFARRLEERTVVAPDSYICKGQVFACLYKWIFFEPIHLPKGQLGTRLWNWCDPRTPLGVLWKELLGDEAYITDYHGLQFYESEGGRAYYLVGYCPIDERNLSSGYAILNTLLLPGMDNTPEAAALQCGMTTKERYDFSKRAEKQSMRELSLAQDFSAIRDFHKLVPQVRIIAEPVFDGY